MNPDDLARILDELGQRLGPTGEYVFGLAVRQVYLEGILAIAGAIFALVVTVIVSVIGRRLYRASLAEYETHKTSYYYGRPDASIYLLVIGALDGLILSLAAFWAWTGFLAFANPEYAALRDILSAIGGAR